MQKKWRKLLKNGKGDHFIRMTTGLTEVSHSKKEDILKATNYFVKNRKRMQYKTFREKGFFIGSGVIEAGCKTVVGKRTKQSGMFWHVSGAQNVLSTRCVILGGLFNDYREARKAA